jgi:ATP synthase A1 C subunit
MDALASYMNARVRGMRSALLPQERLEDLLELGDVQRLCDALMSTPYEQDMAEALTRYRGADAVEEAASRHLAGAFQSLLRAAQGPLRTLAELFLERWDLIAVKSLLRARHHELDPDLSMQSLTPGPSMTVAMLRSFADRGSMEDLMGALIGWKPRLCGALEGALEAYRQERSIRPLEEALDRTYFVKGARKLITADDPDSRIVRGALQMEIDRINLRTLLQLKGVERDAEALLARMLPLGALNERRLREMIGARDVESAMELLGGTAYQEIVERLYIFLQTGRFSPLERQFDRILMNALHQAMRTNVMSIAVLMHYAWLKYNEVVNLRLIARGAASRLPRGKVREEMVYA